MGRLLGGVARTAVVPEAAGIPVRGFGAPQSDFSAAPPAGAPDGKLDQLAKLGELRCRTG